MRILIPILLLGNIVCFYSANFICTGVIVKLYADAGPFHLDGMELKTFNLKNSVEDMWNAKVYPLAILIAAFSGIW